MKKGNGVTRKLAEKIISEIPDIATKINNDDLQIHTILKIAVYGSFVNSDKELLGDLDLAVLIKNKYEDISEFTRRRKILEKTFKCQTSIERLFKAGDYVYKSLCNGRKCIHINPYDILEASELSEGSGYKVIYVFKD